jgi:hypothetical protein
MKIKSLVTAIAALPLAGFAQSNDISSYASVITAADMRKDLEILASDEYEGRETGKKGQKMAAAYIANAFRSAGIPPYKNTTYFQVFPLNLLPPVPATISIKDKNFVSGVDFYNFPGQTAQKIQATSVLFAGFGIEEEQYSDYKGLDVKGKILMVMAGEPVQDSISVITGNTKRSLWSTYYKLKPEKAREKGAAALLIITDIRRGMEDNRHKLESPSMKLQTTDKGKEMPVFYISQEMADQILGKSTQQLISKINSTGKPASAKISSKLKIDISSRPEEIWSENVLGYVEGSDLKNELVVVTAHYDHLGKEGDVVYNGADDDGSGTVAVMAMARAFAKAKQDGKGPRRSMLFMAVAGEEKGLLGSSYYTENPVFPLENTIADLNIDMIGRLDEKHAADPDYIYIIGSDKLSSDLHRINEKANQDCCRLKLDYTYNDERDRNRFYYRSDHYNFAKKGIPVIFYFNGVHADYHKETDEVSKIDFNKMEKISRLVFFTAWELANRDQRIRVDSNKK